MPYMEVPQTNKLFLSESEIAADADQAEILIIVRLERLSIYTGINTLAISSFSSPVQIPSYPSSFAPVAQTWPFSVKKRV